MLRLRPLALRASPRVPDPGAAMAWRASLRRPYRGHEPSTIAWARRRRWRSIAQSTSVRDVAPASRPAVALSAALNVAGSADHDRDVTCTGGGGSRSVSANITVAARSPLPRRRSTAAPGYGRRRLRGRVDACPTVAGVAPDGCPVVEPPPPPPPPPRPAAAVWPPPAMASPSGSGSACTEASPCSLDTALSVVGTVILKDGTYPIIGWNGSAEARRILSGSTVRAQNPGGAVINGLWIGRSTRKDSEHPRPGVRHRRAVRACTTRRASRSRTWASTVRSASARTITRRQHR